ncbi:MAG: hypothetical protein A3K13_11290, partial [Gemmatimonadetes bacterium RIFCSPLOWO2_12_FULL_68_9]
AAARDDTRIYLTGGATAVLIGWRGSTIDVDIKIVPERDELFRAIPHLKERSNLNVELACPSDFIPALPGWEARSIHVSREGLTDWFHYDLYSQALSKIERHHAQDAEDVRQMLARGLVEAGRLREFFEAIRPGLIRYPAIDPAAFARRLDVTLPAERGFKT